jgi:tripartite-type tricarboxylate transporter receptor subunit TctC
MRRLMSTLAAFALGLGSIGAQAQDYPSKPIRLLIPFPPGGGTDFVSRLVGNKLAEMQKWTVVLENRAGAGGNIALEAAAKSPPDGYTIVMGQTDNVMLGPWLYANAGYDTVKSFAPIAQVSRTALAIVSGAQSQIRLPADMMAKAKSPAGLTWASAGNGTVGHLFAEQLKRGGELNILHVPYKGASPALTDVMGGQIDVGMLSVPSVFGLVKSGKLRSVAVTTAKRSAALPDAPSLAEAGHKDIDVSIWLGLFAPAGTPAPIVARLHADVTKVLQAPDVIEKMAAQGVSPGSGSVEEFAAFVRADYARWGSIVKDAGVKVE